MISLFKGITLLGTFKLLSIPRTGVSLAISADT
jgi:hypothetical protein